MISPLPGITTTKPGSATLPLPGVSAELVDTNGAVLERGGGFLTLTDPWPGMLRTIWGDDERYQQSCCESGGDNEESLASDHAKNVMPLRAEGHANADLLRALTNCV